MNKSIYLYIVLSIFFILLALGKDSPIYLIFDIFPFNLFRTPSKYLLMVPLYLYMAFSLMISRFSRGSLSKTVILFLLINFFILVYTAFNYHTFIDTKKLMRSIETVQPFMSRAGSYLSVGFSDIWNTTFKKDGWKSHDSLSKYLFLNAYVIPNSNLVSGISSFDVNTGGLRLRRSDYINELVHAGITEAKEKIVISTEAARLSKLLSLTTLLTSKPLEAPDFRQKRIFENTSGKIYVNTLNNAGSAENDFYLPQSITYIRYVNDVDLYLREGLLSEQHSLVEKNVAIVKNNGKVSIKSVRSTDDFLQIVAEYSKPTFIVLRKNWYPEWRLRLDGRQVEPIKTNLIHMGIVVPGGVHTIELSYSNSSVWLGTAVAAFGLAVLCVYVFISSKRLKRLVTH